jgi:hypothetical protein
MRLQKQDFPEPFAPDFHPSLFAINGCLSIRLNHFIDSLLEYLIFSAEGKGLLVPSYAVCPIRGHR